MILKRTLEVLCGRMTFERGREGEISGTIPAKDAWSRFHTLWLNNACLLHNQLMEAKLSDYFNTAKLLERCIFCTERGQHPYLGCKSGNWLQPARDTRPIHGQLKGSIVSDWDSDSGEEVPHNGIEQPGILGTHPVNIEGGWALRLFLERCQCSGIKRTGTISTPTIVLKFDTRNHASSL